MRTSILLFISLFVLISPWKANGDPIHVQVVYSEPWGYFQTTDNNGFPQNKLVGIWVEIIHLLSHKTGIEFRLSIAPHARVLQNLEHGKMDMSFQVRPDQDSENIIYLAEMLPVSSIVASVTTNAVKSYEDLMGKRIGLVRGTKINKQFDNDRMLFKQAFRNYEIIVTMLFQKRLDVIVGDSVSIPYLMKKKRYTENYSYSFILHESTVWMQLSAFSLQNDKIKLLVKANETLKKAGKYKKIIEQYIN